MTGQVTAVNTEPETLAPLRNVRLFYELMVRIVDRRPGEDNLGVFHGPSGYGKSCAATYCRAKHRGVLIRIGSTWTGKYLAEQIAGALNIHNLERSTPKIITQIVGALLDDPKRPIILDEADYLVKKSIIETVRDISDSAHNPVILIGEESLKAKLASWDRFHDRVLDWVEPVKCDLADTRHLARLYTPGVSVDDDLLDLIRSSADGRARRIVRHLGRAAEISLERGLDRLRLCDWDGQAPAGGAA